MTTSKDAWELAWRHDFPSNARAADERDARALLSRSAYKCGYSRATADAAAKGSPGPAGSALTGDGVEAAPTDSPAAPLAGTPGGFGELEKLRAVARAAWLVLAWIDRSVDGSPSLQTKKSSAKLRLISR